MIKRGSYMPYIYDMWRPGTSNNWFFMNQDSDSRRGKWGAVEIKFTMDLIIGL